MTIQEMITEEIEKWVRERAAILVRDAVAVEREACAALADETNQWIGAAIRARGNAPPPQS